MNGNSLSVLYNLVLYLYPRSFQRMFGREMAEVFCEVMAAAEQEGRGAATRRALRELFGMLTGALREQLDPISKWFEKTLANRPVVAGITGYAVGFALLGLPDALMWSFPSMQALFSPVSDILLLFLSGWLGAALLTFSRRRKEKDLFRQGAGLSQVIILLFVSTIYNQLFPAALQTPTMTLKDFAIVMLYPLWNGLLIGLLLAILRGRWSEIPLYGGLGIVGFCLGWLASRLFAALMDNFVVYPALPVYRGFLDFFATLASYLILGAIIGAALGLAYRGMRPMRRQVTA